MRRRSVIFPIQQSFIHRLLKLIHNCQFAAGFSDKSYADKIENFTSANRFYEVFIDTIGRDHNKQAKDVYEATNRANRIMGALCRQNGH